MIFSIFKYLKFKHISNQMSLTKDKITEIFYLTDEFCHHFEASLAPCQIGNMPKRKPLMAPLR